MKLIDTTKKLVDLRYQMSHVHMTKLQAIIIPSSDAHQSEYLADCDKRREYISGFTGSAGTAVVTLKQAALWTDGRYFTQAIKQLDQNWTLMKAGLSGTPEISEWLNKVLPAESVVGCNSSLYSSNSWTNLENALKLKGHQLIPTSSDLIDEIWKDKPKQPSSPLKIVDFSIAGATISDKVDQIRVQMKNRSASWLIVTSLDDIAWLLNLRGSDIQFNPVFFSYIIIGTTSIHLFINEERLTIEVKSHLSKIVTIHTYDDVLPFIKRACIDDQVWISQGSSHAISSAIPLKQQIVTIDNPVAKIKAFKNPKEIEGMKKCNIDDAVALCRFLHWMEIEVPKGHVTECSASKKSLEFRKQAPDFVSLSFDTISSSGPTGSIIHYKPLSNDDKPVLQNQIYLIDSGGQYKTGTTDTTRTLHFGQPTDYEKECFTRVLKGHIALASVTFPGRTKGYMLDTLARVSLWNVGLDYLHGTGHGVGSFLNVHEGPIGLYIGNSSRITAVAADSVLKDGFIVTNEPGYYEEGKFGIRIENAMLCIKADTPYKFGGQQFYRFETIALVPIQLKLIEKSLLTESEINWLNNYHSTCQKVIGSVLRSRGFDETYNWLLNQTKPI